MSRNRTTSLRNTMTTFPFETDFYRITKPDNNLNTFSWELRNLISKEGMMKSYTDEKETMLVEDYVMKDRTGTDNIWLCVDRMKKYYDFDYGFVQPSTLALEDVPHGFRMGKVIFYNVSLKEEN